MKLFIEKNIDDLNLFESNIKGELTVSYFRKKPQEKKNKEKIINKAKKFSKKI